VSEKGSKTAEKVEKLDTYGRPPLPPDTPENKLERLYWWLPTDKDCPTDLVINAGNRPVIVGAQAQVPSDSPRMDMGDRRQGAFYVQQLVAQGTGYGVIRLAELSLERARQLERDRKIRVGILPPPWVERVREKAAKGEAPSGVAEPSEVLASRLTRAASGLDI
jgi:hypothetical protein